MKYDCRFGREHRERIRLSLFASWKTVKGQETLVQGPSPSLVDPASCLYVAQGTSNLITGEAKRRSLYRQKDTAKQKWQPTEGKREKSRVRITAD